MVRDYNTRIRQIPANSFGFAAREFFEIDEGEKAVPQVRLEPKHKS